MTVRSWWEGQAWGWGHPDLTGDGCLQLSLPRPLGCIVRAGGVDSQGGTKTAEAPCRRERVKFRMVEACGGEGRCSL